ncbi:MAG: hypothetical protein ACJASL_003790 [Paraglaciecola sp.]|jgi:hypothetical protein
MELVNRYILAVKQALPAEKQDEIGRELKANILDEIDALSEQNANSDDTVNTVLNKYGHPDTTANRFYNRPALVAGIDMPLYKKVLTHSAAFLFTYAVVRTLLTMLQDDSINPLRLLFQAVYIFVEKASLLFLVVTLVFYYVGKSESISAWLYRNWSLDKLPPNPDFKISNFDTITDIITNSFLLLVLWTHLWMSEDVYQQHLLALAPSAEHWRNVLTVLCVQSLLQAFYRLTQTHWQRKSYIAYIFDHAAFAIAAIWMAATTPLLVVRDSLNANLPSVDLSLTESSQSYFLLSVAAILIVLMYFQFRKLPNLK